MEISHIDRVRALIEENRLDELDAFVGELHPADIADVVEQLDGPGQVSLLKRLGNELAAEVLTEVDEHSGQTLLQLLSDREVVSLLGRMPSDDAADLMSALPPEKTERVDALMPTEDRDQIHGLMEFDEDSAGGIMELERVAVRQDATVRDAIRLVRSRAEEIENLQKIYIVDDTGRLVGVVRILDLLLHSRSTPITDLMEKTLLTVPVEMDQEEVAGLFGKYDEFTLPVVDPEGTLVGRITVDDIIDVIEEEASEDIARIAGTKEAELGETSVAKISRARMPWLITSLAGQLFAAALMSFHEQDLARAVVLTFFVPLIIGSAGSVGIQAAVVVVREIALGQAEFIRMGQRVLRELQVAILNGAMLGAVLFGVVWVWRQEFELGLLLWGSLMVVIVVAGFIGSSIPLLLHRWRIDPAIATGPFITVSNDIIGLAIYLAMASAYLAWFG